MTKPIKLFKGFLTVGAWTFLSRVFGFIRDVLFAAILGAGPVAEAFFIAFSLPNMFRRLFAEGAFNTAFVPIFSKKLDDRQSALDFAEEAFAALGSLLILLVLVAQFAMPLLVLAMASGFWGDERFDTAIILSRIAFPYILFISLASLLSGVLNSAGRFAAAAAAPILLNLSFIGALVAAAMSEWNAGLALSWATPIAGILQLSLVWYAARKIGFPIGIRVPRLTPDIKWLARLAIPAALAGGVVQINLLVGRQVASFFDGAVAWLSYADRLYQLPLGVVGIAIGVVLLPDLSRKLSSHDDHGSQYAFNRATEVALALSLPAAVAFAVIPVPIISVLFERGEFGSADTAATAAALAIYAIGLPAFVLQKVLQPLFFAREDTRTPFRYALVCMFVNAVAAIGLAFVLGFLGAAIGTTVASWMMVVLLWRGSRRMGNTVSADQRIKRVLPRIVIAAAAMGLVLWPLREFAISYFEDLGGRYMYLAFLVFVGAAIYFVLLTLLGAWRPGELLKVLKRH